MGTISDKLMRVINTKEDIRQALISKGYDVPTSIPFKEYAKMISDLPCKVDDFPKLPGDVTRWHFGGLTNEMMAAMDDPRIEDADYKGRFLSFKNFAWKGMSGVGGYAGDFSKWKNNRDTTEIGITESNLKVIIDVKVSQGAGKNIVFINKSDLGISNNVTIKITSTYPEGVMKFANSASNKYLKLPSNGVITLQDNPEYTRNEMYLHLESADLGQITIEQLPLYPGFILGDGVDDGAATIDNLNLEDTYTVYTSLILLKYGGVISGKSSAKDFSLNTVTSSKSVGFDSANAWSGSIPVDLYEFALVVCKRNPKTMYIKDLITGKANQSNSKEFVPNPGKHFIWRNTGGSWCRVAIAGQIICNGHFATDEEDEKVLNWHKKQYPWLFPDQAWTVVGKTNEDEDRATIANITGNGNDLILSNFGFAEGSGYGLYKTPFELYPSVQHSSKYSLSFSKFALGDHNLIIAPKQNDLSYDIKVKVTGLKDGVKFKWGWIGTTGYIDITTDGIHMLNKPASQIRQLLVEFAEDFDPDHVVTIEQIPEYEGYLVTDGVDDEVRSAAFTLNEDWTIVGNWEFITNENKNAGLTKVYSLYLYNRDYGIFVYKYINAGQGFSVEDVKSLKAICSDGRIYLNDWQEIRNNIEQEATISKGVMAIGYFNRDFTKIAFKNLGIYNNQLLSKDDCIKAYNYLQTLKSK